MEHITIVLVSSDQEYGKALGLGLLHVCRSFMIRILNPQEILQDNEKNSSDLIIWDGELPEEADAMQDRMIQLVEKPSMIRMDFRKKEFCLYRYSCAQSFVSDIFEIYENLTGRHPVNVARPDIRIFAFTSWEGGDRKSVV